MFGKKKENEKPTTLEEVKQAYENLSDDDKKSFNEYHQSIAERVHESVASEREHAQEDSQSAEASEHEALDEEHAEGKGDVEELTNRTRPKRLARKHLRMKFQQIRKTAARKRIIVTRLSSV